MLCSYFAAIRRGFIGSAVFIIVLSTSPAWPESQIATGQSWRVVDGDTIHMDDYKIRLLGIDAPEIKQLCQTADGHDWACGIMARDVLRAMLESQNQMLVCRLDGKDRYNRDLGSCYIGSIQTGIDVQKALIRAGLAVSEYGVQYKQDERAASVEKRGMWAGHFMRPKDWRKYQRNQQKNN